LGTLGYDSLKFYENEGYAATALMMLFVTDVNGTVDLSFVSGHLGFGPSDNGLGIHYI
jgi:hypothetical protein